MNGPLTRKARLNTMPLKLDLQVICDQCGTSRAHGNHKRCSKQRQAQGLARRMAVASNP